MNVLFFVALIILAAGLLAALKAKKGQEISGFTFDSRETLFSPAERSFLGVLEQALDNNFRLFAKVRLGDLVKPGKGLSNSKRTTLQNRINQKHVDYVLCKVTDLAVVGVIELDDQSHGRTDRVNRDDFVDRALAASKISVARFSVKKGYSLPEVRAKLAEYFAIGAASAIVSEAQDAQISEMPFTPQAQSFEPTTKKTESEPVTLTLSTQHASAPVCPKCEAVMVKRQAMKGAHAGKFFWACSEFPKCRQVVAIEELPISDGS